MNGGDIPFLALGAGLVVGFGLTAVGAYVGEAVQEKRERVVLEETELDEAEFANGPSL